MFCKLFSITLLCIKITDAEIIDSVHDNNVTVQDTLPVAPKPVNTSEYPRDTTSPRWSLGIVPYYIDNLTYDNIISRRIQVAMQTIKDSSCVIFKQLNEKPALKIDESWLHFTNPTQERECVHEPIIGTDEEIIIILGFECMKRRDVLHSLLHGIGFRDEVSHPQRDQFIRVLWENVQPKYRPLFRIQYNDVPQKTLVEYDPLSVMHFHDRAYSSNGGATISPLVPGLIISPSENLSQLDKMKLRMYFGHECNKRKVGGLLDTCKNMLYDGYGEIRNEKDNIDKRKTEEDGNSSGQKNIEPISDEVHNGNGDPNSDNDGNSNENERSGNVHADYITGEFGKKH